MHMTLSLIHIYLIRVKHTTVLVSRVEQAEEIPEPEFEMINGTCASVRLDALIGLAFQTSRSSMVSFIESGLVFVDVYKRQILHRFTFWR